jgi:hypothetical protein
MGSKTQKTTTNESKSALPEYQQAFSRVLAKAQPLVDEEYEQYGGDVVADLSGDEEAAFGRLRGNEGDVSGFFDQAGGMARDGSQRVYGRQPMLDDDVVSGLGRRSYGWLEDSTGEGPQYSQESLQQYMDPYLTGVLGTTLDWMGRSDAQAQDELTGNAIAKGAWGGDRAGLAKADLARSQGDQRAKTIASITSDAFRNAQDQFGKTRDADAQRRNRLLSAAGQGFNTFGDESARRTGVLTGDQDRLLRGAASLADIGSGRQSTTLNNLNALISAGKTQRDNRQDKLTSAYDQFQKKKEYSRKNLDWLANLSTGLSSAAGGKSTSETLTPGPNLLSQLAGTALAGAKLGSGMGWFNRGGVVRGDPLTRVLARFGLADGGPVLGEDPPPLEGDGWSETRSNDQIMQDLISANAEPPQFDQYLADKARLKAGLAGRAQQNAQKELISRQALQRSAQNLEEVYAKHRRANEGRPSIDQLIRRAVYTLTGDPEREVPKALQMSRNLLRRHGLQAPQRRADGGEIMPITVTPNAFVRRDQAKAKRASDFDDWNTIVGMMQGKPMGMADGGIFGEDEDYMDEPDGDGDDDILQPTAQAPGSIAEIAPKMQQRGASGHGGG